MVQQTKGETSNELVHKNKNKDQAREGLGRGNLRSFHGLLLDRIRFLDAAAKATPDDGAAERGHFRRPQAASNGFGVTACWAGSHKQQNFSPSEGNAYERPSSRGLDVYNDIWHTMLATRSDILDRRLVPFRSHGLSLRERALEEW
jgi:hypothetical protein